jgi:very-short-patch-repair endonuclease
VPEVKGYEQTRHEILLGVHLRELDIEFRTQEKFCIGRDWRLDFFLPEWRVGIEVHGGQHTGGHRRGYWGKKERLRREAKGWTETPQEDEYLKLSVATMLGIRILQFSNEQVWDGRARKFMDYYVRNDAQDTPQDR